MGGACLLKNEWGTGLLVNKDESSRQFFIRERVGVQDLTEHTTTSSMRCS